MFDKVWYNFITYHVSTPFFMHFAVLEDKFFRKGLKGIFLYIRSFGVFVSPHQKGI